MSLSGNEAIQEANPRFTELIPEDIFKIYKEDFIENDPQGHLVEKIKFGLGIKKDLPSYDVEAYKEIKKLTSQGRDAIRRADIYLTSREVGTDKTESLDLSARKTIAQGRRVAILGSAITFGLTAGIVTPAIKALMTYIGVPVLFSGGVVYVLGTAAVVATAYVLFRGLAITRNGKHLLGKALEGRYKLEHERENLREVRVPSF